MVINRMRINIMGREYIIKSGADPEHVVRIANHLNRRIEEVSARFQNLNREQTLVLAAMNITDDFLQLYEMIEQDKE